MPWSSSESRKKWKKKNRGSALEEKAKYNRLQGLHLTDNYIKKRIRDRYGINNPSRKLLFFKGIQMLFYRELSNVRSSIGYERWVKRLNELVEEEGGIRNWNRKRRVGG